MKIFLRFIQSRYLLAALFSLAYINMYAETGDVILSETFDTEDDFNKWTIVDNNGGRTWEFLNGMASYMLDYQTGLPGDDWYISPEFTLAADRVYELEFDLAIASRRENLKVCLGTSADPSSFTQVIDDFNDVDKTVNGKKTYKIYVKASGTYRLGFYAYSEAQSHRIDIDNVLLTDISAATVPGQSTALTVTPAERGGMAATVAFTAPSLTANDETLTGTCDINIYRNGDETAVKTFTAVTPGATLTWNDETPTHGFNAYKVVASNADGTGQAVEQKAFVGLDKPMAVTDATAKLNADKSVTVTWTAPTASVNGGYVDFDNITYNIDRNGASIATAVKGTSYTDNVPVERGQALVAYTITPVAATETGEAATSSSVVTGSPLAIPYKESFANQTMSSPWHTDGTISTFEWGMIGDDEDGEFEEVMTQDSDNGMIYAESKTADYGEQSRYVSPLLDLSSAVNPVLKFWFYKARSPWYDPEYDGAIDDRVSVQISYEGGEWQNIDNATFYLNENLSGWNECEVILPKGNASFVNIAFLATAESEGSAYRNIYIDNISIDEAEHAKDLALSSLTADNKRIDINATTTLTAAVFNRGSSAVADYTVDFYRDGEVVATVKGAEVEPAKTATVTYTMTATPADAKKDSIVWMAKVNYEGDELLENNVSTEITTSVRGSELPTVTGLTATGELHNAKLKWNEAASVEAVAHGEMTSVTDDFESYKPFIIDGIGDWTVYDGDKATTLNSPRIPYDYDHQGEPMAFQVFNIEKSGVWVEDFNLDDAFRPIDDGKQILICPSVDYPAENDDWLITPRLDGREQTITFYAKSASYDSEWINVYYSTTDNHHDSFTKLNEDDQLYVADNWRMLTFDVPEGARYFAVRCVRRCVMLMIDNFTYAPYDDSKEAATLVGYNVYRNDVKLNESPIKSAEYVDKDVDSYDVVYTVTAVYDRGESDYSNESTLTVSSISGAADAAKAVPTAVYSTDGKRMSTPVRGVNIVRMADGTVHKVIKNR